MKKLKKNTLILSVSLLIAICFLSCSSEKEYKQAEQMYKTVTGDQYQTIIDTLKGIPQKFHYMNYFFTVYNRTYTKAQFLLDEVRASYIEYKKKYLEETYANSLLAFFNDYKIHIRSIDGKFNQTVTDNGRWNSISWSADGQKIAFSGLPTVERKTKIQDDIFIFDLKSSITSRITHTPDQEFDPSWSPDGKELVFVRYTDDQNYVVRMNLAKIMWYV